MLQMTLKVLKSVTKCYKVLKIDANDYKSFLRYFKVLSSVTNDSKSVTKCYKWF